MKKRAVILAGGKGTRLKPYTISLPKSLMPVGEFPILEIVIRQLSKNGFKHITLAVNHQAKLIESYFADGSEWDILIDYSKEIKQLSTMGPLKNIKDLPENFLVMNGDVLTDLNYKKFFDFHINNKNLFTISSFNRKEIIDYGVLNIDKNNNLTFFNEKPVKKFQVSMGIYMINKSILGYIPNNEFFGFDHLMKKLLDLGKSVNVKEYEGYWLDIGRPDDYIEAIKNFEKLNLV